MNIKLSAWYFLHDKPKFWNDIRRKLHILKLEESQYYPECERFYSDLDVAGKVVIDVGCDFGTTPIYFLRKGALKVVGLSKDKRYFHDPDYIHINVDEHPDILPTLINRMKEMHFMGRYYFLSYGEQNPIILKSDCEGCEWNFTPEFIQTFYDWIIAVHNPVKNPDLLKYIQDNGTLIGDQGKIEFGIYRKRNNE